MTLSLSFGSSCGECLGTRTHRGSRRSHDQESGPGHLQLGCARLPGVCGGGGLPQTRAPHLRPGHAREKQAGSQQRVLHRLQHDVQGPKDGPPEVPLPPAMLQRLFPAGPDVRRRQDCLRRFRAA